jgi:hypothetical protein
MLRIVIAFFVTVSVTSSAAFADQISGKWIMSNGNALLISGNSWSGMGYAGRNYAAHSGSITRTSPTTFKFHDVNGVTRDCRVSKNRVTCTPMGASWRRG